MEMSWMQTVDLLGLDLLALVILALVALQAVEHALHAAWNALSKRGARTEASRPRITIGAVRHV